jgi:hypothetical protein
MYTIAVSEGQRIKLKRARIGIDARQRHGILANSQIAGLHTDSRRAARHN